MFVLIALLLSATAPAFAADAAGCCEVCNSEDFANVQVCSTQTCGSNSCTKDGVARCDVRWTGYCSGESKSVAYFPNTEVLSV